MEITAGTDPFALFQNWFDEAVKTEINDPDAIALASVDASGMPSVRMVLLRRWSPDGFLFFTNYESRKSDELLADGQSRLLHPLEKPASSGAGCRRYHQSNSSAIR